MDKITNKDRQEAHKVSHPQIKADMVMLVTAEVKVVVMAVATRVKIQEKDQQIKDHPVNNKMERSHSKSDGELVMMPHFIVFLFLQNGLELLLVKVVL